LCLRHPRGRKGWRLPTNQELASLIDPTQSNPALPSGHPFTVQLSPFPFYWSATTWVMNANLAWVVNFNNADLHEFDKSDIVGIPRAWCVRAGQGVDPQ
jgi:Protein of unknown function (DUF1566)